MRSEQCFKYLFRKDYTLFGKYLKIFNPLTFNEILVNFKLLTNQIFSSISNEVILFPLTKNMKRELIIFGLRNYLCITLRVNEYYEITERTITIPNNIEIVIIFDCFTNEKNEPFIMDLAFSSEKNHQSFLDRRFYMNNLFKKIPYLKISFMDMKKSVINSSDLSSNGFVILTTFDKPYKKTQFLFWKPEIDIRIYGIGIGNNFFILDTKNIRSIKYRDIYFDKKIRIMGKISITLQNNKWKIMNFLGSFKYLTKIKNYEFFKNKIFNQDSLRSIRDKIYYLKNPLRYGFFISSKKFYSIKNTESEKMYNLFLELKKRIIGKTKNLTVIDVCGNFKDANFLWRDTKITKIIKGINYHQDTNLRNIKHINKDPYSYFDFEKNDLTCFFFSLNFSQYSSVKKVIEKYKEFSDRIIILTFNKDLILAYLSRYDVLLYKNTETKEKYLYISPVKLTSTKPKILVELSFLGETQQTFFTLVNMPDFMVKKNLFDFLTISEIKELNIEDTSFLKLFDVFEC